MLGVVLKNHLKELLYVGNRNQLLNCLSCQISISNRRWESRRPPRDRWGDGSPYRRQGKVDAQRIADVLDVNHTDWPSIQEAANSYNPHVIPLEIRMGRRRNNRLGDVPSDSRGNVELLKIPNFFHLTPPAIKRHCEVLKEYCTEWPNHVMFNKVRVTTINYLYAGPSVRHPESRKVKLQIYLKDLYLDDNACRKFKLLVGERYNPHNDELTLITDKCPTRKQNKEYAYFLLTALYYESIKREPWEEEIDKTEEEIDEEVEIIRSEMYSNLPPKKKNYQRHYRVINDKIVRFNSNGYPFVYEMRKYGIKGGLSDEEMRIAKEEWAKIQKDVPDNSTFDPPYKSSFCSEFSLL